MPPNASPCIHHAADTNDEVRADHVLRIPAALEPTVQAHHVAAYTSIYLFMAPAPPSSYSQITGTSAADTHQTPYKSNSVMGLASKLAASEGYAAAPYPNGAPAAAYPVPTGPASKEHRHG